MGQVTAVFPPGAPRATVKGKALASASKQPAKEAAEKVEGKRYRNIGCQGHETKRTRNGKEHMGRRRKVIP